MNTTAWLIYFYTMFPQWGPAPIYPTPEEAAIQMFMLQEYLDTARWETDDGNLADGYKLETYDY